MFLRNCKNIFSLSVLALMLITPSLSAANELTNGIQQHYKTVQTMTSAFTQILRHKESGAVENRSGMFYFKAPKLIRWATENPSQELLVVNDEAVWNYFKDEEVVYKYPASLVHETKTALRFITGQANIDDEFYVEPAKQEDGLTALHLFAKEPTTDLTEATLWIAPDFTVKRILTVDFYGNENEIHFAEMKFDKPIEDSFFNFTPPKGVDVEDRTKTVNEQKIKE